MGTLGLDVGGRHDEVVVSLRGELDAVSAPAVDLTELDFLDCSAVGLLMQVRVVARGSGSDVVLANSRGSVLKLLTMLGLASPVASDLSRSATNEAASYILQTAR
jgi:anti-anti-sigma factor